MAGAAASMPLAIPYTIKALLILASTAAPMLVVEAVRVRGTWVGFSGPPGAAGASLRHAGRRLLGLAVTLGLFAPLFVWVFPQIDDVARPLGAVFAVFALITLVSAAFAFAYRGRDPDPGDASWRIGDALLRWSLPKADGILWEHFRQWTLKSFFIPFMFWAVSQNLIGFEKAVQNGLNNGFSSFANFFDGASQAIFLIDVSFGCIGYVITMRALGSEIRSTNPYWSSWFVCLVCYPPFWPVIHHWVLDYDRNLNAYSYLGGSGMVFYLWVVAVIGLEIIYVWATIIFGIRFSNLTNRGIVTNGPYRLFKHPAYLAKNVSWWLWSLPFVPLAGWREASVACAQLLVINLIYVWRAKTEEMHLREDPAYPAYEAWIRDNSMFGRLRRALVRRQTSLAI